MKELDLDSGQEQELNIDHEINLKDSIDGSDSTSTVHYDSDQDDANENVLDNDLKDLEKDSFIDVENDSKNEDKLRQFFKIDTLGTNDNSIDNEETIDDSKDDGTFSMLIIR